MGPSKQTLFAVASLALTLVTGAASADVRGASGPTGGPLVQPAAVSSDVARPTA